MSEVMDLVVIEKQNAMAVFTTKEQLDPLIEKIEKEARSLVADVSTKKGRDAIASMAHKVARSKTYIDNAGKDLVTELKALPKQIDESRRIVRERLDALKDEVRRPLTEWEAEQERIKQEEEARIAVEALAKQVEADHEIALLMDREFDRQREEARLKAEQEQREREEKLKREAAEAARLEAEKKAQEEREAAARRELELKMQAEQAERARVEAEKRAEREKKEAAERAEREKQAAIDAEKRRAQEEADRIRREAEARESARIAEQQRIAAEEAARAADVKHRKIVGTEIVTALLAHTSVNREQAIEVLTALKDGLIPRANINY
ncbi:hypothetical protein R0H17_15870 [Phytobacter diazotrophicus]|uniref:hypothetical protein n=1 Tax=Phytobacter diazotrophicus TaxID=395631 RepID=UPI0029357A9B|nr:hypothetical protein [Phytobacter diazotrophicus]MDV2903117.1 hypothetical protein [Phytobacter diazotrophicus]